MTPPDGADAWQVFDMHLVKCNADTTGTGMSALTLKGAGGFFVLAEVTVPPRLTLEPDDLVTPTQAARILGPDVTENLVRVWIHRHGIEPLGKVGRWNVYDYNEIAAIDAARRRKQESREAA